jgi:hypothetical protein
MNLPIRPDGTVPEWAQKRHDFTVKYCKSKGWPTDPEKLSIDQIMEIRDQPEWKDAAVGYGQQDAVLVMK